MSKVKTHWQASPVPTQRAADLCVRVVGDPQPNTVVMLHGLAGSQQYFGKSYDALAANARLVVPDLLGFGRSAKPWESAYSLDVHSRALMAMLNELNISGPVTWIGHSAGSLISLYIAATYPERAGGVIALCPPLYASPNSAKRHFRNMGLQARLFANGGFVARWTCAWMCHYRDFAETVFEKMRPDLPGPIARDAVHHHWHSYLRTLQAVVIDGNVDKLLERISCPLTFLVGNRDPVMDLPFLHRRIPRLGAQYIEISSNHDLPLSRDTFVVDLLQSKLINRFE